MKTELTIDDATPEDLPHVLRFVRELAAFEKCADQVEATVEDLHRVHFGPGAHVRSLIARLAGQPVGFALWFFNYSTWTGRPGIYLEDLYVAPEARGRGVGEALLSRVAAIAVERGCARFEWWVLDWNESAIGFYERLGASAMRAWIPFRISGEALRRLAARGLDVS